MAQLRVSDQPTDATRAFGYAPFTEVERLAKDCIKRKVIRNYPVEFIGAMLGRLAEATTFVAASRKGRTNYCAVGFETFWHGIAMN